MAHSRNEPSPSWFRPSPMSTQPTKLSRADAQATACTRPTAGARRWRWRCVCVCLCPECQASYLISPALRAVYMRTKLFEVTPAIMFGYLHARTTVQLPYILHLTTRPYPSHLAPQQQCRFSLTAITSLPSTSLSRSCVGRCGDAAWPTDASSRWRERRVGAAVVAACGTWKPAPWHRHQRSQRWQQHGQGEQ